LANRIGASQHLDWTGLWQYILRAPQIFVQAGQSSLKPVFSNFGY